MKHIEKKLQKELNRINTDRLKLLEEVLEFKKEPSLTDKQIKKLNKIKEELL